MTSLLDGAIQILRRAVELETKGNLREALVCYQEGIQQLMQASATEASAAKKETFRNKIEQYLSRAEVLKDRIQKEDKLHLGLSSTRKHEKTFNIDQGQVGCSYSVIFRPYLSTATSVTIRDPYIRRPHQIANLIRFLEMCKHARIGAVHLITSQDEGHAGSQQVDRLKSVQGSCKRHSINFTCEYEAKLHDREVVFDNGWIVKIGRGLDYFQPPEGEGYTFLGAYDFDLRPCKATTVDIFKLTAGE
eukprot:m.15691 g.15691  ORF g.15691 m.15691 type:complete len:247 (+) comp9910_c0_seq1:31-771(+)